MIGGAILEIEQAQLVEAVQEWLDKRWTVDAPVVTAVVVEVAIPPSNYTQTHKVQPETFRIGLKSNLEFVTGKESES